MQLVALLDEARQAPPGRRIEWRDRIAPYGARAIEAVRPWLAEPALAAFAVRVIEGAGQRIDDPKLAPRILRAARREASPPIRADIDWALSHRRARLPGPPVEQRKPGAGRGDRLSVPCGLSQLHPNDVAGPGELP